MNETVAKIVELLFQDIEMNDEVQAIHDEVMDNCQERYSDLVAHGLTEDEAIGAVVESLKGMEDVLKSYPRKSKSAEPDAASDEKDALVRQTYSAESLKQIDVDVVDEDVTIEPSSDDQVHVETVSEKRRLVTSLENGVLHVRRLPGEETARRAEKKSTKIVIDDKELVIDDKFMEETSNLSSVLGRMLGRGLRKMPSISIFVGGEEDRVMIRVPVRVLLERVQIHTTSADVNVKGIGISEIDVSTTSGDVCVEQEAERPFNGVKLRTTSGDVQTDFTAKNAKVSTMSGDINMEGDVGLLAARSTSGEVTLDTDGDTCEARTVSGDVNVGGAYRAVNVNTTSGEIECSVTGERFDFGTVSGDVTARVETGAPCMISGRTTSGDVRVELSDDQRREVDLQYHSVSGDQSLGHVTCTPGAALKVTVSTVSGDLMIR